MQSQNRLKGQMTTEVSISSEADILYWCGLLRVSPQLLTEAYQSAGPRVSDVENFLLWRDA